MASAGNVNVQSLHGLHGLKTKLTKLIFIFLFYNSNKIIQQRRKKAKWE
jgi:hypothetical protein